MQITHEIEHAVKYLQAHKARFVLCRGKHPVRGKWNGRRRPGVRRVLDHIDRGGACGIVPASVGLCVVDVDRAADPGAAAGLICGYGEPLALIPTRRGLHGWFRSPLNGVPDRPFSVDGLTGDILNRRFALLHSPAAFTILAAGFEAGAWSERHFLPSGLLENPAADPPAVRLPVVGGGVDLAGVMPGARNETMFRVLMADAGRGLRDPAGLLFHARTLNDTMPVPMDDREVAGIARSVARYARSWKTLPPGGLTVLRHDTELQAERGRESGRKRRARTEDRDKQIAAGYLKGKAVKALAREHGISPPGIRKILGRNLGGTEPLLNTGV